MEAITNSIRAPVDYAGHAPPPRTPVSAAPQVTIGGIEPEHWVDHPTTLGFPGQAHRRKGGEPSGNLTHQGMTTLVEPRGSRRPCLGLGLSPRSGADSQQMAPGHPTKRRSRLRYRASETSQLHRLRLSATIRQR